MIRLPEPLRSLASARSGIAAANLLDVQNVQGDVFSWSDRALLAPSAFTGAQVSYVPWILRVPNFSFHRSLVTDTGNFILQNLSGDSLTRDFEKILRRSTLEGAFFIYRLWQPDAEAAWRSIHGTFTVDDIGSTTVTLKSKQLIDAAQDDTPLEIYCETCQLQWGGVRCGSTESEECSYSFPTCQVPERAMVVLNSYEKNYGSTDANVSTTVINRRRRI